MLASSGGQLSEEDRSRQKHDEQEDSGSPDPGSLPSCSEIRA